MTDWRDYLDPPAAPEQLTGIPQDPAPAPYAVPTTQAPLPLMPWETQPAPAPAPAPEPPGPNEPGAPLAEGNPPVTEPPPYEVPPSAPGRPPGPAVELPLDSWFGGGERAPDPTFKLGDTTLEAPALDHAPSAFEEAMGIAAPKKLEGTGAAPIQKPNLGNQALTAPEAPDPYKYEQERVAKMTPEEFAAEQARAQAEKAQLFAKKQAQIDDSYQTEATKLAHEREQDLADVQAKYENLNHEWETLGQQKIDNDHWWKTRSTGQKIAGYLSAAIDGFLNPGGRNPAIELMQQQIEQDIDAQKHDLEMGRQSLVARQGLVSRMAAITGDLNTGKQAALKVSFDMADKRLANMMAGYDPAGTRARSIEQARRQVRALGLQADAKLKGELFDRRMQEREADRKDADLKQRERESRRSAYIAGQRLNFDKQKHEDDMRLASEEAAAKARQAAEAGLIVNPMTGQPFGISRFGKLKPEEAIKDQDSVNQYVDFQSLLSEYTAKLKKAGRVAKNIPDFMKSQDAKELIALQKGLGMALAKAQDPGSTVRDSDLENALDQIGGLQGHLDRGDPVGVARQIARLMDDKTARYLSSRGVQVRDKSGHFLPGTPMYDVVNRRDAMLNAAGGEADCWPPSLMVC